MKKNKNKQILTSNGILFGLKLLGLFAVILLLVFSAFHPAAAQYQNQEKIPGAEPTDSFTTYIQQIINFGFAVIGILALFMLIIGAYQYLMAAGNIGKVDDAKETMGSALLGLVLGLCAWIILYKINPDLVNMRGISALTGSNSPMSGSRSTAGYGTSGPGTGRCEPVASGPCSVQNLSGTCFGSNASQASAICNAESGGGSATLSRVDVTRDGHPFSVGLFQINLTVHDIGGLNCPSAFSGTNKSATVINQSLYQQCVQAAQDPATNIQKACAIGGSGSSWGAWGANSKCGF